MESRLKLSLPVLQSFPYPTPPALRASAARSRPSCRRRICRGCRSCRGSRTVRTNSRKSSSPTPQVPLSSGGSIQSSHRYFRERPLCGGLGLFLRQSRLVSHKEHKAFAVFVFFVENNTVSINPRLARHGRSAPSRHLDDSDGFRLVAGGRRVVYNSMHHEPTEGGNGDESIRDGPCGSYVVSRAGVDDRLGRDLRVCGRRCRAGDSTGERPSPGLRCGITESA